MSTLVNESAPLSTLERGSFYLDCRFERNLLSSELAMLNLFSISCVFALILDQFWSLFLPVASVALEPGSVVFVCSGNRSWIREDQEEETAR